MTESTLVLPTTVPAALSFAPDAINRLRRAAGLPELGWAAAQRWMAEQARQLPGYRGHSRTDLEGLRDELRADEWAGQVSWSDDALADRLDRRALDEARALVEERIHGSRVAAFIAHSWHKPKPLCARAAAVVAP